MMKKGILASAGVLIVLLLMLKPALLELDGTTRLLALFRWQGGEISFVNSVTGKPVVISFSIGSIFNKFHISTDTETEAYYSHGTYDLNTVMSRDSTAILRFCSVQGIHLDIGFYKLDVKNGCLEVSLLWMI